MEKALKKEIKLKDIFTATNIMIVILVIFYILDKYLPFPKDYTGFVLWDDNLPPAVNYIFGWCGGLLMNHMAVSSSIVGGMEIYRQFTSMFLHGDILHLIANLVGLYFIGNYAEKRFGWWLTYIVYFLAGFMQFLITDPIFAAIAPEKFAETYAMPSVGASGGIFALIGLSLAAIFFDIKSFKKIGKPTIIASAIYGILTTYVVSFGWTTICHNVSMILGLIFGVLIILPFFIMKKGKFNPNNITSPITEVQTDTTNTDTTNVEKDNIV